METTGLVSIDERPVRVSGQSWMDHEFGTNQLGPDQIGWDWFSLQFDNGEELMLYQMRHQKGRGQAGELPPHAHSELNARALLAYR
jgi:predicted secreted hydrolase